MPAVRSLPLAAYSMTTNRMALALGYTQSGVVNEVWLLTNANGLLR
jgi:hypothetical protein